jgi:glycosyltransferase involved in cell wall biosynthesis
MHYRKQIVNRLSNVTKISIIIRCFNEEEHIAKLLVGLSEQTIKDIEIIIVDSGSTDATLSIAAKYTVKNVYISPEEFSFGRALNVGCREASGDLLVFISAHCYPVYSDWLENLTKPFDDPNVALTYGKQIGGLTTKYSEHQIFASWYPDTSDFSRTVPFCNNANAAIRKDLWMQFNYNEDLTGLEDIDWARQAITRGFKIAYSAQAVIVHLHNESFSQVKNRYKREAIALKKIYPGEKFSFLNFVYLFIMNAGFDEYHAIRDGCFTNQCLSIVKFRFLQFWGTYRGFCSNEQVTPHMRRTFYYPNVNKKNSEMSHQGLDRYEIQYSRLKGRK